MNSKKRIVILVIFLTVTAVTASGLLAKIINNTIATVNGKVILRSEFDKKINILLKDVPPESLKETEKVLQFKEQVLDEMINEMLVLQDAESKKVTITNKEITDGIDKLKTSFNSPEEFDAAIKDKGLTMEDLKTEVKNQLIKEKMIQKEIVPKVKSPTEAEIEQFYKDNKEDVNKMLANEIHRTNMEKAQKNWLNKLKNKASIIKNDIE